MTKVILFGKVKIVKKNPWLSGKLAQAVKMGLAKIKKEEVLADPPPWFGDPSKLSKAQVYQALRFSRVSHETKGMPIDQRLSRIKKEASGPTGLAKPKTRIELAKVGRLITIAERFGIPVPENLRAYARPVYAVAGGEVEAEAFRE